MGTLFDRTWPRRARFSAIAALLAALALLLTAWAGGATTSHNSSRIARSSGAAAVHDDAAGVPVAVAAAAAPAALTGPGAGSWGARLDLFYRNSPDGRLAHQWYVPGPLATWTAAESLGGALTSILLWPRGPPAATTYLPAARTMLCGTSGSAAVSGLGGSHWRNSEFVAPQQRGAPVGLTCSSGIRQPFVHQALCDSERLVRVEQPGRCFDIWASSGVMGLGRVDVLVRGTDNAVWHKWFSGGKWSGWESLGGRVTGEPGAASTGQASLTYSPAVPITRCLPGISTSVALAGRHGPAWAARSPPAPARRCLPRPS